VGHCVTTLSPHNVVILQDHLYLDPPILGVQRRLRVKCRHPDSQNPHLKQCTELCPKSHHHFTVMVIQKGHGSEKVREEGEVIEIDGNVTRPSGVK
jgi:hypothetical protein